MKNKVSLANAGYALFLLFFALEPLLGKWNAYWYALCGLAVVLGVVLVVGIVTAFVMSVISIKFLMGYIKKNDFTAFGIYRIIVGALVLGYFAFETMGMLP